MSNFDTDYKMDNLIDQLKDSKNAPAVLKLKMATVRAQNPDVCIIAFEGPDDKQVYFHWIKRIDQNLIYEPFICKGKNKVLQLRRSLKLDRNNLKNNVYYIVDRDYDDLQGDDQSDDILMTDRYSFENYLVTSDVFEETLKHELHCHGEILCRRKLIGIFNALYCDFLRITKDINFRIFLASKLNIERAEKLPEKVGKIAAISLTSVGFSDLPPHELVPLAREPSDEEIQAFKTSFEALDPTLRYRGKFALLFFRRWLDFLIRDRNSENSELFPELDRDGIVAKGPISLDSLAARASPPINFHNFILSIIEKNKPCPPHNTEYA